MFGPISQWYRFRLYQPTVIAHFDVIKLCQCSLYQMCKEDTFGCLVFVFMVDTAGLKSGAFYLTENKSVEIEAFLTKSFALFLCGIKFIKKQSGKQKEIIISLLHFALCVCIFIMFIF